MYTLPAQRHMIRHKVFRPLRPEVQDKVHVLVRSNTLCIILNTQIKKVNFQDLQNLLSVQCII